MSATMREIRRAGQTMMRRARVEAGLTQGEMAAALSRSLGKSMVRTQVVAWEVGRNMPGLAVVVAALALVPPPRRAAVMDELLLPVVDAASFAT